MYRTPEMLFRAARFLAAYKFQERLPCHLSEDQRQLVSCTVTCKNSPQDT